MLHPDDVTGLVLIDSDHPEYETQMPEPVSRVEAANINALAGRRLLARLGVLRLLGIGGQIEFPPEFDLLPPETRARAKEFWVYNAQVYATLAAENQRTMLQESRAQVRRLSPGVASWLPDVPLLVITHGIPGHRVPGLDSELAVEEERVWQEMQQDMAAQGHPLRGEPLVAEQSAFSDIPLKQPDLIIAAILEVVDAAR
jgi:pimeloyl-ACP methyl ester carboxylesterase